MILFIALLDIYCISYVIKRACEYSVKEYKADQDPAKFKSVKTGRGPLGPEWKVGIFTRIITFKCGSHTVCLFLFLFCDRRKTFSTTPAVHICVPINSSR